MLECFDNDKKEVVAIKIVRSIHKYREAAMIEIDVLQKLARHDVGGTRYGLSVSLCSVLGCRSLKCFLV